MCQNVGGGGYALHRGLVSVCGGVGGGRHALVLSRTNVNGYQVSIQGLVQG